MTELPRTAADRASGWAVERDDSYAQTGYNPGEIGQPGTTLAVVSGSFSSNPEMFVEEKA